MPRYSYYGSDAGSSFYLHSCISATKTEKRKEERYFISLSEDQLVTQTPLAQAIDYDVDLGIYPAEKKAVKFVFYMEKLCAQPKFGGST